MKYLPIVSFVVLVFYCCGVSKHNNYNGEMDGVYFQKMDDFKFDSTTDITGVWILRVEKNMVELSECLPNSDCNCKTQKVFIKSKFKRNQNLFHFESKRFENAENLIYHLTGKFYNDSIILDWYYSRNFSKKMEKGAKIVLYKCNMQ